MTALAFAALAQAEAADTRQEFSELFAIYMPVAGAVFVIVLVMLIVATIWRRKKDPSRTLKATKVESAYVIGLAVVAGLLLWRTYSSMGEIEALAGPPPASVEAAARGAQPYRPTIRVVASQWTWRFEYGGGVVQQGGPRGYATLVVPTDTPVRFRLTSLDVVHAFFIPDLRFKMDAYPDLTNVFDLVFRRGLGYKDNRCAEFCGLYHAKMLFNVDVRSPAAFRAWLAGRRASARAGGGEGTR